MNRIFLILFLSAFFYQAAYCQPATSNKQKEKLDSIISPGVDRVIDGLIGTLDSLFVSSKWDSSFKVKQYIKDEFPLKQFGWVNDFEYIFSKEQTYLLDSIISEFEKITTVEIAIVTIDSSFVSKEKFDGLIHLIGNIWGVGKEVKNNGIIVGLSAGLRKIKISNGYGIEGKLSDKETKKIIDEIMIPEFRQANYFEGAKKGLIAIMAKLK